MGPVATTPKFFLFKKKGKPRTDLSLGRQAHLASEVQFGLSSLPLVCEVQVDEP